MGSSRDWKQAAGVVLAPMTGGASLLINANEHKKAKKEDAKRLAEQASGQAKLAQENSNLYQDLQKRGVLNSFYGRNSSNNSISSPFKTLLGQ